MGSTKILSLIVAAFSGAVGALLLRSILRLISKLRAGRIPLVVYDCALDESDNPGIIRHGWGKRVLDRGATDNNAWEHNWTTQIRQNKEHTIFGPYTNDFGMPGFFKIAFRVFGSGFSQTNDPVVALDVVQAPFGGTTEYILIGQRIIIAKELNISYRDF